MQFAQRRREWIFGALFGAWLGGVYALASQAINWIYLPDIPLAMPSGSFFNYLIQYILLGAFIGLVSLLPESGLAGVVLGALCMAVLLVFKTLKGEWGFDSFGGTSILMLISFLPLVILMTPVAFLIRLGVDSQSPDPSRPHLWARRYIIPGILTLLVVVVGCFSLYSKDARSAFDYTDKMIKQAQVAGGPDQLPAPLKDVANYWAKARGLYTLEWSDRVDTFFGPRPAGDELSQFLIIARFDSGFTFACIYSPNRAVPTCTNY